MKDAIDIAIVAALWIGGLCGTFALLALAADWLERIERRLQAWADSICTSWGDLD